MENLDEGMVVFPEGEDRMENISDSDFPNIKSEFEAAGGMDIYKPEHLQELIHKVANGPLWDKAKKRSEAEYGSIRWPFVMYLYEKMGGNT